MITMANTAFSVEAFRADLEEFTLEARKRAEQLQNEWQTADGVRIFWDTLAGYIAKGWVCHIQDQLDNEKERLRQWRTVGHPAITTLENLYRDAKSAADMAMIAFPSDLETACTHSELEIDRTSREPHYTFQNGFLELDVDTAKHLAHVKDREAKLVTVPADIGAVIEVVTAEQQRLFGRPFEGDKFLRKLRSNYQAVLRKEGLADGEVLPIRRITHRLGKNEKGFHTDEFLIDLSKLLEQGPLEIDGAKLDLQQTKDINQGILLHGVGSHGYIGFIVFRKV